MNRRFSSEPASAAARVGRIAAAVLELGCKAAVIMIGLAIVLGMLGPRPIVSESPGAPHRTQVDIQHDRHGIRILPQPNPGQEVLRLFIHDPRGQEAFVIEYHQSGSALFFGEPSSSTRVGLRVKPRGGIAWCMVGRRAKTDLDIGPDGAMQMVVRDANGPASEIGRIRVPPTGEPSVTSGSGP